jgi:hypothetical protein
MVPMGDEISAQNANYYSSHDVFEKIFGKQGDIMPVGFYNGMTYNGFLTIVSPSHYRHYNVDGNVLKWTGEMYEVAHCHYMPGGSKADYASDLRNWMHNDARPDHHSSIMGFGCAQAPAQ